MSETLPGQLLWVFLVSIIDAALLSWLTLLLYRRSVRRLMRGRPAGSAPASPLSEPDGGLSAAGEAPTLQFDLGEQAGDRELPSLALDRPHGSSRLAIAYSVGAALYAAVITLLKFAPSTTPLVPAAWAIEWWINTWPIVPALIALLVLNRRDGLRLAAGYFLAGAATVATTTLAPQIVRGSFNSAPITNVFWMVVSLALSAWPGVVLILLTGWRRVRAVMPLALAVTLIFGFALMAFNEALIEAIDLPVLRDLFLNLAVLTSLGTGYYGLFMLASLPVGWLAWRALRALAHTYEGKRFSDVQMIVDCWWIVVTAEHIVVSLTGPYGMWGTAGGLAAFAAYRGGVWLVLRGAGVAPDRSLQRLLLLRVFGYEARTEALFDTVAQRWRFRGPVQLIAGVDLTMPTADPGDILAFVNGRLADNYVRTLDEIPRRIGGLDVGRDPDGRFRINEVYCHDDTWKSTLEALLDVSDRVLMDLRSFGEQNSGCIFELEQLVRRVDSDHIVLVSDSTTDLPLLRQIMGEGWDEARRLGAAKGTGRVALVRMEGHSERELALLMDRLIGRAAPVPSPPELGALA
jgi:hypothetical protein